MTTLYKLYGTFHGSDELPDFLGEFESFEEAEARVNDPDEVMELCDFDFYIIEKEVAGVRLASYCNAEG